MQSFRINGPADPIELEGGGASTAFVVTNTGPGALDGTAVVRPQAPAEPEWFAVRGEATRRYETGAIEQVEVVLTVPPATPPGAYSFRLDVYDEDNPDEDYTEGPLVQFSVPVPPKPVPWWRRYWWALAIGAAVLVAVVVLAIVLFGGDDDTVRKRTTALTARVQGIVQAADADASAWTLAAAGGVQVAIDDAESAYARHLDRGVAKAPPGVRDDVEELERIVAELGKSTPEASRAAARDAKVLAGDLVPFGDRNPVVTSYSPMFVTPAAAPALRVRVDGRFGRAIREGEKRPALRIGGRTIEADFADAGRIEFPVPADAVPAPEPRRLASVAMDLDLASETAGAGPFRLLLNVLPDAPLESLALTTAVTTRSVQTNQVIAPPGAPGVTWHLRVSDCRETVTERAAATPGWSVIPESAALHLTEDNAPGHGVEMTADASAVTTTARIRVPTSCVPSDGCFIFFCERLAWYVTYTEQRTLESTADERSAVTLLWGERLSLGVAPGRWRLDGTLFDGTQIQGTGSASPYLKVEDQGGTLTLRVPAPDDFLSE